MNDHLNEHHKTNNFEMNDRNSRDYRSVSSPNPKEISFSKGSLGLQKIIYDKIDEHRQKKNKTKKEASKKMIFLFCINSFIFICARDLPTSFHQIARIKKEDSDLSYLESVEYSLIYWIPNMFLPLILGFISDYAANIGSVKILLITMQIPLLLSQLLILPRDDSQGEGFYEIRLTSRFLFSFSGETLFIMLLSLLTAWFKFDDTKESSKSLNEKEQIDYICLFIFWGFIASAFVNMIVVLFCYYYEYQEIKRYNYDFIFFRDINIVLGVCVLISIILNFRFFQTFSQSEKELYEKLEDEEKNYKKNSDKSVLRSRTNSSAQKEKIYNKQKFPTSFCDALTSKILTFQFLMIGVINAILYGCMVLFQDIIIHFLFYDFEDISQLNFSKNSYMKKQDNAMLYLDYYRNSNFLLIYINLLKSLITILFIPNFLKRTGNRNFLMTLAIILYLFAFSVISYYLHAIQNQNDEIFYFLKYFIIFMASSAICIASALQMNSFVSYIPTLIDENLYVTAYGFFACVQSIFIVFLHLITNIMKDMKENLNLSHIVNLIGVILIFLILSFIIIIILEYKYYKELYSTKPYDSLKKEMDADPRQVNDIKPNPDLKN